MPLTIAFLARYLDQDERQLAVDRLRGAGYVVLDTERHGIMGESTEDELRTLRDSDLRGANLVLWLIEDGQTFVWPKPSSSRVESFPSLDAAVVYLEARAQDDNPAMVPELF